MATVSNETKSNVIAAVEATKNGFAPGDTITSRVYREDGSFIDSMGDGGFYEERADGIGWYWC